MKNKYDGYSEDIDKQLIELLDTINEFPGVKTCFSCCGHGKSEFYIVMDFTNARSIQKITKAFTTDYDDEISYLMQLSDKEKRKILLNGDSDNIYMYKCELMPLYFDYGENRKTKIRFRIGNIGLGLLNSKRRKEEINRIKTRLIQELYIKQ